MRHLVVYSYYETYYGVSNLSFFMQHGVKEDPNIHYVFVVSSPECSVPILPFNNVTVVHRENYGYDFGGWGAGLKAVDVEQFDRFIFLNTTALGPFLPRYLPPEMHWYDLFTHRLQGDVKMVGSTINYLPQYPDTNKHIQSYSFALDRTAVRILLNNSIFDPKASDKQTIINEHEVMMSKLLLIDGYDLFAFQLSEAVNSKVEDKSKLNDDPNFDNCYYGLSINPLEVMFVKSNRLRNDYVVRYRSWLRGEFVPYP
jgi:lipopolysaccharide biosynthesis protein